MPRHMSKAGTWKNLVAVLAAVCALGAFGAAHADILVVAPHPDDDVITSSGVIVRALDRGETVRVVFMSNGDYEGKAMGFLRQDEAVAAQAELGVPEDDLIFLGYPDGGNIGALYDYYQNPASVLNHNGQRTTYGVRGMGRADYHTFQFGSPATYTASNVKQDLAHILWSFQPDHVFVTADWDGHDDHRATYFFVRDALAMVRATVPAYDPIIHKTIVWAPGEWPNAPSPETYFAPLPWLTEWSQRESIDVPLALQSTVRTENPKYRAIARHASQGGNGEFIGLFLHKDEVFWPEQDGGNRPPVANAGLDQSAPRGATVTLDARGSLDLDGSVLTYQWRQVAGPPVVLSNPAAAQPSFVVPTNLPARAKAAFELVVSDGTVSSFPDAVSVTVGSDIPLPVNVALTAVATASSANLETSQTAAKAIDGVAEGAPINHTREWATVFQGAGAWIQLTWSAPQIVDRIVLFDRPNPADQVTAGRLSFSDGSSVLVGELRNDGGPTSIAFTARRATWIRFEITSASSTTQNVGLSEFQAFTPPVLPANPMPVAIVEPEQHVGLNVLVTLDGSASYILDDRPLQYAWTQVGGIPVILSDPASPMPKFTSPGGLTETEVLTFELVVTGGTASVPVSTRVFVEPPRPENVARQATVRASSENPASGQTAVKAVDGFTDGHPTNATHEWVTQGQRTGAWIELAWMAPQTIDRVVLFDRPNGADHVRSGVLTFSDGSTVQVGALDNAGGATHVTFPTKRITWVRFAVGSVSDTTQNVGLAEFQIWSVVGEVNLPPMASAGADQTVDAGATVQLRGDGSSDPDGRPLGYSWTQAGGPTVALSDSGTANPTFLAPMVSTEATLTFELVVGNGLETSAPAVTHVIVRPYVPVTTNLARSASVTASSQNVADQQLAVKAIDGVIDGSPGDYTREWATTGQGAGAWIQLSWPTTQVSGEIVLHDRPNAADRILAATLTFSDGHEIQVGPLDNAGGPTAITFSPRFFLWVRLAITQVSGSTMNVGLAEFRVLEFSGTADFPPVAVVDEPQVAHEGEIVLLRGDGSYDPEGAPLTYAWTQVAGPAVTLSDSMAANPTFVSPATTTAQTLVFQLVVSDGHAWSDPATTSVAAMPQVPPSNLAAFATVTASSQNVGTNQLATAAVDGVAEGFSRGSHEHEWATAGQRAGAWLRLDWSAPRTVGSVILYDRPNLYDHVLGGILEFSDGTTVVVGPLDNAGDGVTVSFSPRDATFVRFVVTEVSGFTSNVGLSEIEVFE